MQISDILSKATPCACEYVEMDTFHQRIAAECVSRALGAAFEYLHSAPSLDQQSQELVEQIVRLDALLDQVIELITEWTRDIDDDCEDGELFEVLINVKANIHVLHLECPIVIDAAVVHDFDPSCKANGYRSLLRILAVTIERLAVGNNTSLQRPLMAV